MKRKELKVKLVFQADGKLKTDSLIVAQVFGKEHKNVMRDIRNITESDVYRKRNQLNFELVEYKDAKGEMRPKYEMDRQGFEILAMGFTGEKALEWKFKYSDAFAAMEAALLEQKQQPFMPRGYPQMLEAARNNWKRVRNELIDLLSTHLQVYDRKKRSQFTNQIYLNLIETTARRLREHFLLTHPNQLTRDYLHQLVQESIVEIEIRLSDALMSGSITSWKEFKNELEQMADHIRYMKELQNGRIPLPQYAYPIIHAPTQH